MKLVAIAGALREGSLNKQLLRLARKLLEKDGAEIDLVDLRALSLPFYDGDLETSSGLPARAQELVSRIGAANGLVIASPEYNFSVPAVLKNAIDWVTRAKPMPLRGKTAVLLSALPSLASAQQAFDDNGELKDEALGRFLRSVLAGSLRTTRLHAQAPK